MKNTSEQPDNKKSRYDYLRAPLYKADPFTPETINKSNDTYLKAIKEIREILSK